MAIKSEFVVRTPVVGDGTSVTFTFDLKTDPYTIQLRDGTTLQPRFWMMHNPISVASMSGECTATLTGATTIQLTFATALGNGVWDNPATAVYFSS